MPKKIAAALTTLALALPAAPVAVAYDRVCIKQTGAYNSKFYLREMQERPPHDEINRRHYGLEVSAGLRKCTDVRGAFAPGTLFAVNIRAVAGKHSGCYANWSRPTADVINIVYHDTGSHILRWPETGGDLEVTAGGQSLQSTCGVSQHQMWEGCAQGLDAFAQPGCTLWRPAVAPNSAYDFIARDFDIAYLDSVLDRGANPNVKPEGDEAPLHLALRLRKVEHFRRLLQSDPDINIRNTSGRTPLLSAIWEYRGDDGLPDIVRALLAAGADPGVGDNRQRFPLHDAARNGQDQVVRLLLEAGDDPGRVDGNGKTPLEIARDNNQNDAARALFAASVVRAIELRRSAQLIAAARTAAENEWADMNRTHKRLTPLQHAVRNNMPEVVQPLLDAGADPNLQGDQVGFAAIHDAVKHSPQIVQAMLAAGADPNLSDRRGFSPLHWALDPAVELQSGTTDEIVAILIAAGADPNHLAGGEVPLHLVSGGPVGPRPALAQMLLDAGANPHILGSAPRRPEGYAPVHFAAAKSFEVTRMLAEQGADFSLVDSGRDTPLHWTASVPPNRFATDIAIAILQAGGDPNAKGRNGETPLFRAAKQGQAELVGVLMDGGADPNVADENGQTALNEAAKLDHAEVVRAMIEREADVNYVNPATQFTPLTEAVLNNKLAAAQILVEAGADPDYRTPDGYSVLGHAIGRQFPRLVELLVLNGADLDSGRGPHGTAREFAARTGGASAHALSQAEASMGTTNAPLVVAVLHNRVAEVRELLDAGADPDIKTSDGNSLIRHAVGREFPEVARFLILAGADFKDDRVNGGETPRETAGRFGGAIEAAVEEAAAAILTSNPPLTDAVLANRADEVRQLLQDGGDPNIQTWDGYYLIHHAIGRHHHEVAAHLVLAGAELDENRDAQGRNAREFARSHGNRDVRNAIRRAEHARNN